MAKIGFVAHEHDDDVGVGVIPQFLQPSVDVLKGCVSGHVVDEECTYSSSVVSTGDGSVPVKP